MNAEKAAAICEAIALGSSMAQACRDNGVKHPTFLDWVEDDKELADRYARARQRGWALLADEIIAISDEVEFEPVPGAPGQDSREVRVDSTAVARNRLRVDSRKWMLSKMLPKVYGDKVTLGGDPDSPVRIESVTRRIIDTKP